MSDVLLGAFGGLGGLLVLASGVVWGLLGRRPGRGFAEVRQRLKTWWVLAGLLLLALAGPEWLALGMMAGVSFVALREYLTLAPTRPPDHGTLLLAYAAIPGQYLWVGQRWYGLFLTFIPVYVFLLLPLRLVAGGEAKGFLRAVGTLHWGLMTTVFGLSHVAYLLVLPARGGPHGAVQGAGLVFFLLVLTQLNDVAQFLWGKWLGRRKITPTISPNKTLEGLLGGVLTSTVLAGLLGPWLTPLPVLPAMLAGGLLSLCGFGGDVVISAVKRDAGVKESGSLLPGHGGLLDRVDSLMYTAPLFFHALHYFYY